MAVMLECSSMWTCEKIGNSRDSANIKDPEKLEPLKVGAEVMREPREIVFEGISDSEAVLQRLRTIIEGSEMYRRGAFYESTSSLFLQLTVALERSWTAIEEVLGDLAE
jgi:hypothetical protein